jgi:lysophospholipase
MGGVSQAWLEAAISSDLEIQKHYSDFKTPVLLFQAGDDQTVEADRQNEFCAKASRCELIRFDGAFHQIFMEKDAIRSEAFERAVNFFTPSVR